MLLGYDVDPRDEGRTCRATSPRATSSSPRASSPCRATRSSCSGCSPTSPSSAATARRARTSTPSSGCTARGSTSTPTCRAWTSSGAACPRSSAAGWPRVLAHYGVTDLDRTPELEEAVFRDLPRPAALGPRRPAGHRRCCSAGSTEPAAEPPARPRRPRRPRPAGARHPAALPRRRRPGPQRALPLVRPAARRRRAGRACWPASATRSPPLAADPDAPDRAARIDALAAIPEQIVRFLAERLEGGVPEREPMLEVLVRRHYREHDLHDLRTVHRGGPPVRAWPTTRSTTAHPPGLHRRRRRRAGRPASALVARRRRRGRRAPDRPRGRGRPVPALAGRAGVARARPRASSPRLLARSPFAQQRTPDRGRRLPGAATARSATSPSVPPTPAASSRTTSSAACTRWSGAGSTSGGCATSTSPGSRRPRTCCSTTASRRTTPPTSGSSRWPQVRQLAVVRDEDGRVTSLPHAERAVANCLEAIRRARAPAARPGARLDMNHVWSAVWPVVDGRPRPAHRPAGARSPRSPTAPASRRCSRRAA